MIRRREVITLLGGAAAWPLAAQAQQPARKRRIGALLSSAENDPEASARIAALQQRLEKLGWIVGRDVVIDYRWGANNPDRIRAHAAELVRFQPEVILAGSSPVVAALRQATNSIPIVFVQVAEPVAQGFVASMARPGGNVTGFTNIEPELGGKWLGLIKEIAPRVVRGMLPFNRDTAPYAPLFLQSINTVVAAVAIEPIATDVHDAAGLERVVDAFAREPDGALIVLPGSFATRHRNLLVAMASKHRLPAVYPYRFFVTGGGLISYGPDPIDEYRSAAAYLDRILRGEKPSDLPVQAPTRFELVINLKTAKALGLTVPDTVLARADEVIE